MKIKLVSFAIICLACSPIGNTESLKKTEKEPHLSQAYSYIQNPDARPSLSLNGAWSYIIDPYENGYYNHRYQPYDQGYFQNKQMTSPSDLIEYDFSTAETLQVPGDWNTQAKELLFYEGTIWYHRNFQLNKQLNKRYVINFGAVNYAAIVYVNGKKVGRHEGGFTGFQFDISDYTNNGDNFITVKVDNRRERDQVPTVNTDWWNYGGITREVSILELPDSYIANYRLQLSKANQNQITTDIWIDGKLKSTSEKPALVQVSIPELGMKQNGYPDKNGKVNFTFKPNTDVKDENSLQQWSPKNPKLYSVELSYNGEVVNDKVGFRTIETKQDKILLNGKPIFLRGISIHEESPLTDGRAWSEADARILLGWAKELGANFVRLAHYPHNETMLKVADELGLLVWSEIPVYWTVMFDDEIVYNKAESQLVEMIRRDFNRVSVALWSVANETPNSESRLAFLTRLIAKAKTLDESRLFTAAMDTHSSSSNGVVIDDPLIEFVDVIGINHYCGWYYSVAEKCAEIVWENPYNKPVMISEFGAGALQGKHGDKDDRWTEEYQANAYKYNLQMLMNIPGIQGVSPWVLKDFRSPRRPLANIQDFWNRKGLLSETGIKKQAWWVLNDFYVNMAIKKDK
ncbi:glycoside hydrolase family 2 protein [Colwellia echini]|uniref:Beta-glucuronidase n=1 Tax=Colwellia echini TaxID=1982103 RepID=A0ABY3N069_9GAMM|nr:glycoside hydrolase family 2 TIM barrel-domain containing protein [Colwellia echini]TYK66873.1 beta-glucuronidase [Colwellia echini]